MNDIDPWIGLAAVQPSALADATLELHWATQILAAAGQTFAEPQEDDSHRAMVWDGRLRGFLGAPFADGYPFRLGLRVEDLTLQIIDRTDAALGELALGGLTLEDGYVWLRTGLSQYMGGTGPVIERPDFAPPEHPAGEGSRFSEDNSAERAALAALYGGAAALLDELTAATPGSSPVRCWPHHFDIATLVRVRDAQGEDPARTVGVGMAPMGGTYEGWYWYVTPWPYPPPEALPALRPPASWHTEGWTGAVLRGSDVVAMPERERRARVAAFLEEASRAAKSLLEM